MIKKLFSAILRFFAALGKLLGLGKKGEFYVEVAPPPPSTPVVASEQTATVEAPKPSPSSVANAAVEPPPVTSEAVEQTRSEPQLYTQFARRRPGANMASFLTMARQVRPST